MNSDLATSIGKTARAIRESRGLTQAQVAEAIDLAHEVYGRLERGQMLPSVQTLTRLAAFLRVSADTLLGLAPRRYLPEPAPERFRPDLLRLIQVLRDASPRAVRTLAQLAQELAERALPAEALAGAVRASEKPARYRRRRRK